MIGRTVMCNDCGMYHESVTVCPYRFVPSTGQVLSAPLPPTAEQTSIARFNALADQIRELEKSLKERQDQDRKAFSSWIATFEVAISIKLGELSRDSARRHNRHDSEHMNLDKKIDNLTSLAVVPDGLFSYRQRMERALLRIERRLRVIRTKQRAVAKKKAAPLVGKKGTGRKG